jgi:hypothetical protein
LADAFRRLPQHGVHDELAELITRCLRQAVFGREGEVLRGIEIVEFACGIPNLLKTDSPSRSAATSTTGIYSAGEWFCTQ